MSKRTQMEGSIDEYIGSTGDVASVLYAVAEAVSQTAEHLAVDWQDRIAARAWQAFARRIEKLADLAGQL